MRRRRAYGFALSFQDMLMAMIAVYAFLFLVAYALKRKAEYLLTLDWPDGNLDDIARLYRIAYSKPAEEAMDKAREQAKGGQPVVMRKRATAPSSSGGIERMETGTGQPYESNVLLPSDINPKTVARNSFSER